MLLILFYLILFLVVHITTTFVCVLRVTCMCPLVYFSSFLITDLNFIIALLIHVKNHFSFAIIAYIIIVIITIILFFRTLPVIGEKFSNWVRAAWSTPTHWLRWISRRVSIIIIIIIIIIISKLFFGDHSWGVDALFHVYHMTSFNYDAKEARNVGLSCRCHLSNSRIVSSLENMLERITCLWLCVSVLFVVVVFVFF